MKKSLFTIRYRVLIIVLTSLVVLGSVVPLLNITINPDLESYLPDDMESKVNNKKISEYFGNEETLLLILESDDVLESTTLQRLEALSETFSRNEAFEQVFSLFQTKNIRSEDGMMMVNPVVEFIPESAEEREALRESIRGNELANGLVVSADFRYTMLMLTTNRDVSDEELVGIVQQSLKDIPGNEQVYLTGQPYLRYEANEKISRDILVLLPIALLVMLLMLWFSFREIKAVMLPFAVVIISTLFAMALIPALGWELSLIGILIPIMMIAIANNYGVHFIARYQELHAAHPRRSTQKLIQESFSYLKKPVLLCGLTTIVGVLGLVMHLLLPASQMGVVASIAIAFALLLSLSFIPAVMSYMKKSKPHKHFEGGNSGFFRNMLIWIGDKIRIHPRSVLVVFVVFFVLGGLGVIGLQVAGDSNKVLPKNHEFNRAIALANEHFGGSKVINILFSGDAKDPALLNRIDRYETELNKIPEVGRTTSLAMMLRTMSKALNDSTDEGFDAIPPSADAVSQYLELYAMSADPADFERFVDFDYAHLLLTIQYQAESLPDINALEDQIHRIIENEPVPVLIGGLSLTDKEISASVESGQYYSLLFALLAIFFLLSLIFKSWIAGLLGSIPLIFAVLCTFGLMGWMGIELNIVTALLSSISIGLGVDFSIHVFWRLKHELALNPNWLVSVPAAILGIGRGISINAISVMIGFSVLFLSSFPFIQSFALLIILSLFLCLVSALVLVPTLCLLIQPSFLINNNSKNKIR